MDVAEGDSCVRARYRISLRIDGELPQLEGALLDAHLRRCPACTEFAAGAELIARKLRPEGGMQALVPPSRPRALVAARRLWRSLPHGSSSARSSEALAPPQEEESPAFAGLLPELRD
jgi:predicted anti-sigma-YlaC factor YlaD